MSSEYLRLALRVLQLRLEDRASDDIDAAVEALDDCGRELPAPSRLDEIGKRFRLSDFERSLLLMAAGTEFDVGFAHACARAQGDLDRTYATFALGLAHLPGAEWAAMSPGGPLRRWRLVRLPHSLVPTTSALQIDERILHALAGVDYLDAEIAAVSEPLEVPGAVTPTLTDAARAVARQWAAGARAVVVHGRRAADLRLAAAAAAAVSVAGASGAVGSAGECQAVLIRDVDLPADAEARQGLVMLCAREQLLTGVVWVLEVGAGGDAERRRALTFAERLDARAVVTMPEPGRNAGLLPRVEVATDRLVDRREAWRGVLDAVGRRGAAGRDGTAGREGTSGRAGAAGGAVGRGGGGPSVEGSDLAGWVDRIAGQFDLGPAEVTAIVAETDPLDGPALWASARRRTRPAIDDVAQRIDSAVTWDDLVLPPLQRGLIAQIAAHLRHRLTVLDEWGFAARGGRGLGTATLFTGPSGTGKTLAAEVIANEVGLDLFRVDLSQTISKYIGETEKNLRRIFDAAEAGGAVLLFDEADALFGKRGEVKDGLDRHANAQVGYLLQRIEAYRGLAVLTTNLRDSLDQAFLRRLRFVVPFPFPDEASRVEIWRRAFPPATPTKDLDVEALARLSVSGSVITNIALGAAYRAADAGEPLDMSHILAATRTEYTKLERPLPASEVATWTT
ncbi:ATP-binding protein [Cryptosporangium sp. NPDC048952]|uniref:ATP-binding protein n=1 Tax=Cryptosporangium sp. NPDC048952 TaxID=3363961 RepID=UPI003719A93A